MCPGPTDLFDQRMIKSNGKDQYTLEFKTMTPEKLKQIISQGRTLQDNS